MTGRIGHYAVSAALIGTVAMPAGAQQRVENAGVSSVAFIAQVGDGQNASIRQNAAESQSIIRQYNGHHRGAVCVALNDTAVGN